MSQRHQFKKLLMLKSQSWIECNTYVSASSRYLIDSDLPYLAKVFNLQCIQIPSLQTYDPPYITRIAQFSLVKMSSKKLMPKLLTEENGFTASKVESFLQVSGLLNTYSFLLPLKQHIEDYIVLDFSDCKVMRASVDRIHEELGQDSQVYAIGFPLGVDHLLRYIGAHHQNHGIKAAISVSNPFDVLATTVNLKYRFFGQYDKVIRQKLAIPFLQQGQRHDLKFKLGSRWFTIGERDAFVGDLKHGKKTGCSEE